MLSSKALHFAEIFYTTVNNRVFDVMVEGTRVLDDYDIVRKAGAYTATTETFTATVTDGVLNISLSSLAAEGGVNNPKISAIEILSSGGSQSLMSPIDGNSFSVAAEVDAALEHSLIVKLRPNPGPEQFTLTISGSSKQQARLRVYNTLGILMDERRMAANSSVILGNTYLPGMYFAEVVQDNERRMIKFIKLSK